MSVHPFNRLDSSNPNPTLEEIAQDTLEIALRLDLAEYSLSEDEKTITWSEHNNLLVAGPR